MSPVLRRRIVRSARGGFKINLPDDERMLLSTLPRQLEEVLSLIEAEDPASDDIARRLFPPAYPTDAAAEFEYTQTNRADLFAHRREALEILLSTATATRLSDEELDQWLTALNDVRLVLGNALDVSEDSTIPETDDPLYGEWVCYHYFSYLVGEIVEALSGLLPPPKPDDEDQLPDDPWGDPPGGLRWDGTDQPN